MVQTLTSDTEVQGDSLLNLVEIAFVSEAVVLTAAVLSV